MGTPVSPDQFLIKREGTVSYLMSNEASMSEHGWREFLVAEGVDDWVVLHGGATAVFRVPSLGEAAQLAVERPLMPRAARPATF